jgi:hypothetical protein
MSGAGPRAPSAQRTKGEQTMRKIEGTKGRMRALQCVCEEYLRARNDEGLFELVRKHAEMAHPELRFGNQRLREIVAHVAYEV